MSAENIGLIRDGFAMLMMIAFIIIALFSALEHTHCAVVACNCRGVTSFFIVRFEYSPKWVRAYSAVWLLLSS